ncbi:MAG: M20/M25/M40 family metallo-hydrolase [Anaerolineae bacterium]|nr:M20/M25/M40 family metallo-hydrolase [Anaerolineae bacterium]
MHAQWLDAFDDFRDQLVQNTRDLVRIPSTNTPPTGAEKACQDHIAALLRDASLEVDYYFLTEVEGLEAHPSYWPGRDYGRRPNVNGVIRGQGGGRSLLLTGHIDTVPLASMDRWQHDPFGAEVEAGRLYGLGAGDMKGGVAIALTVAQAIQRLGIKLEGDLLVESAVDEEFGGVNGTLAGRLRGHNADAAVILEPTNLEVYPAARGARIINLEMTNAAQVVGGGGRYPGLRAPALPAPTAQGVRRPTPAARHRARPLQSLREPPCLCGSPRSRPGSGATRSRLPRPAACCSRSTGR